MWLAAGKGRISGVGEQRLPGDMFAKCGFEVPDGCWATEDPEPAPQNAPDSAAEMALEGAGASSSAIPAVVFQVGGLMLFQ